MNVIGNFVSIYILGTLPIAIQKKISKIILFFTSQNLSRYIIPVYSKIMYKDNQYLKAFQPKNKKQYVTFQDFFTREYIVQPKPVSKYMWLCEGLLCESDIISNIKKINVKNQCVEIDFIFGDTKQKIPKDYYFSNIFLHNKDYHRVHAPLSGKVIRIESILGELILLRPWFYKNAPSYPALRNERVNIDILSTDGDIWYLSIIGGLGVGTIKLDDNIEIGHNVNVGDEIAMFLLGSTCCMASPIKPFISVDKRVSIDMPY